MYLDTLMTALYRRIIRPYIFRKTRDDPEIAHDWVVKYLERVNHDKNALARLRRLFPPFATKPVTVFGITFPNQVGLAAGYDKYGTLGVAFETLGCGFIEQGTFTGCDQKGNPRPRQARLVRDLALINMMGFNNPGLMGAIRNYGQAKRPAIPVGISIGKSKITPIEQAHGEYGQLVGSLLQRYGDYFAVNVSSPNTTQLRDLQGKAALEELLKTLQKTNREVSYPRLAKPLLVKIAPDLTAGEIDQIIEVCLHCGIAGIIATNTTTKRKELNLRSSNIPDWGGLSGKPLFRLSHSIVSYIANATNGKLPIIAVGGIMTTDDARAMFDAGASVIQIFTALIYNGPYFIRTLARELASR